MWKKLVEIVEWLKDPELVASFQRKCGVVIQNGNTYVGQKRKGRDENWVQNDKVKYANGYSAHYTDNSTSKFNGYVSKGATSGRYKESLQTQCSCTINHREEPLEHISRAEKIGHRRELSSDVSDCISDSESEEYLVSNKLLYYVFLFSAGLGNELFYASFFPFWLWNVDGSVGRRVLLVWVFIMYIGQAAKDIIRWPRPSSPPVARLEKRYELEYGMPSTHAMVGAAVPFSLLIFTMYRYEYDFWYAVVAAVVWCTLVCLSRLYMGMHSILDVIVGLALVSVLMAVFLPYVDVLDQFQLSCHYSPLVMVSVPLLLAVYYPTLDQWSTARGDTIVVLGTGAGVSTGSWLNYQLGYLHAPQHAPPYTIIWPTFHQHGLMLLRASIGIMILVATRAILKTLTYTIMAHIFNVKRGDIKEQRRLAFELPIKFFTYMGMAIMVVYLSPQVFHILNIERETWYTEV